MSESESSPIQYPGWEQVQVPSEQSDDAAAAEFGLLPPIPPLQDPHSAYTVQPDTAHKLGTALAARMLRTPATWMWFALLWGGIAGVLTLFLGRDGAVLGAIVVGAVLITRLATRSRMARKYTAATAAGFVPGTVMATRFGPDALDCTNVRGQIRMYYDDMRSIAVGPDAVTMRYRGCVCAFPRELFPDWSIELITGSHRGYRSATHTPVAELCPIPAIEMPTAAFVPGPDTARAMARAYTPSALRPLLAAYLVLPVIPLETALIMHDQTGYTTAVALLAVIIGFLVVASIFIARQVAQSCARTVVTGHPLTVRYGSKAVDFQQADSRARTPYSTIRSVNLRGPIAVLKTTHTSVCPRELLPENAIAHMCRVNPKIKVKR